MRSQDFVNSKNVSPLKDVREEEVTNTQVFQCDAFDSMNHVHCGEVFESEETLEDHTVILGPLVRCPAETPVADFFLRISAKILSISKNFCQNSTPKST